MSRDHGEMGLGDFFQFDISIAVDAEEVLHPLK
jgi:hypothetical protein